MLKKQVVFIFSVWQGQEENKINLQEKKLWVYMRLHNHTLNCGQEVWVALFKVFLEKYLASVIKLHNLNETLNGMPRDCVLVTYFYFKNNQSFFYSLPCKNIHSASISVISALSNPPPSSLFLSLSSFTSFHCT